ncbi:MAG: Hsp20/alpha crystallin family protein [Chloroflexi bacterium]|nr:Hsp20/alpha crystallin family protein [Chloroflexota bacterium]
MAIRYRHSPVAEMLSMSAAMDRAMNELITAAPARDAAAASLPLNLYETETGYEVRFAAPGLRADDIEITLHKGVLTIRGKIQEIAPEGARVHARELYSGDIARSVKFPVEVDAEAIEATAADGIVTIRVAKAAAAQPKKISVTVGA